MGSEMCIRDRGKVWKFYGEATVDGEMAAEAEFSAMMDLNSTGE